MLAPDSEAERRRCDLEELRARSQPAGHAHAALGVCPRIRHRMVSLQSCGISMAGIFLSSITEALDGVGNSRH